MHIMVFEPRLGGHHLTWLRYVIEDLLSAGHRLTVALDGRGPAMTIYRDHLDDLLGQISVDSVFDSDGRPKGGNPLTALAACFAHSGAEHVFVNNLDEFASSMLRRAALGWLPPGPLKGRLSGVYFRPRFLANRWWPIGNIFKTLGFNRLANTGWFHRICLLDEYLCAEHRRNYHRAGLTFLPDPWSGAFDLPQPVARAQLGIATDKLVLLHYGIGTRRKGLHLVIHTMLSPTCPDRWHLLCAGQLSDDKKIAAGLLRLSAQGRATVLDRYVSKAEEQACFAASDIVVLPYVRHFGSSGVLSLAAAAGKFVIASDNGLVGRRVYEHRIGLGFAAGKVGELGQALAVAQMIVDADPHRIVKAARRYARQCDRQAFRKVLTSIYDAPDKGRSPGKSDAP
jgi:glycosyltransferase involved in cell wall biosynthesis